MGERKKDDKPKVKINADASSLDDAIEGAKAAFDKLPPEAQEEVRSRYQKAANRMLEDMALGGVFGDMSAKEIEAFRFDLANAAQGSFTVVEVLVVGGHAAGSVHSIELERLEAGQPINLMDPNRFDYLSSNFSSVFEPPKFREQMQAYYPRCVELDDGEAEVGDDGLMVNENGRPMWFLVDDNSMTDYKIVLMAISQQPPRRR